jgi:hypothetical protein
LRLWSSTGGLTCAVSGSIRNIQSTHDVRRTIVATKWWCSGRLILGDRGRHVLISDVSAGHPRVTPSHARLHIRRPYRSASQSCLEGCLVMLAKRGVVGRLSRSVRRWLPLPREVTSLRREVVASPSPGRRSRSHDEMRMGAQDARPCLRTGPSACVEHRSGSGAELASSAGGTHLAQGGSHEDNEHAVSERPRNACLAAAWCV